MIIRKPYAFIVKHYRVIHLIMLLPLLYILYKSYYLMRFFNKFVSAGFKTDVENASRVYYSILISLSAILIIAFCGLIVYLFYKKKKEFKAYLFPLVFYSIFFILTLFIPGILTNFSTKDIESAIAIMVNGISGIVFYVQPVMIIIFILNGLGFDFKNFEFNNIKDEISLDEEDSEEIELNVNVSSYRVKRGIKRYIRETKYYIIENKMIFMVISSIVGLVLLFVVGKWLISLNRVVRVDQSFSHSMFSVSFNDSLLSTIDYNGNPIQNGKIYLAVKTTIRNNTKSLQTLDTDAFWLEVGGQYYYPVLDRSGKFIDLAKPYYGERIASGVQQEIVLVYEIPDNEVSTKYKIRVLDSLTYKENSIIPKYKQITLKPKYSTSVKNKGTYKLGENIYLKDTNLKNTNILFEDYDVDKTFQYHYDYCYKDVCNDSINSVTASTNKTLLMFKGKIELDETSSYYKHKLGSNKMAQDFMKVEYKVNNKTNTSTITDVTPTKIKDDVVLYEVDGELKKADSINLIITVRNLRYTLKVK